MSCNSNDYENNSTELIDETYINIESKNTSKIIPVEITMNYTKFYGHPSSSIFFWTKMYNASKVKKYGNLYAWN